MQFQMNKQQVKQQSYFTSDKENQITKDLFSSIKEPYLKKIEQTKSHFRSNLKKFTFKRQESNLSLTSPQLNENVNNGGFSSSQPSVCQIHRNDMDKIVFTESSNNDDFQANPNRKVFREWKLQNETKTAFSKIEDVQQTYSKMFSKKILLRSHHKFQNQGFKSQQKNMIQRIYQEIRIKSNEDNIYFKQIIQLFEKCPLFYHIYNIHPQSIEYVIKDNAHNYEDKLTREEFLNLFLINNRDNLNYQQQKNNFSKICVLDESAWEQLKQIFNIFDTFGLQMIQINQFFQKIKISLQYKHLLAKQVIYYPKIKRSYTLQKIIFQCEHKINMATNLMTWDEIKSFIQQFEHIQLPTIDTIEMNNISLGKISCYTNGFMLNDAILQDFKKIYNRLPKYYDNFIKVKQFYSQFNQIQNSNHLLREIVRNEPQVQTLNKVLNDLKNNEIQYMDLDEILQWFSLKGLNKQLTKNVLKKKQLAISLDSSSSDDEDQSKLHNNLNINNKKIDKINNQRYKYKQRCGGQITKIQQFKLSNNKKQSIRRKKVQQMIKEKQQKQQKQLNTKIKANPIPVSLNNQKYQQYRKNMRRIKQQNLIKLNRYNQKDALIIRHFQINTKLFQKPKQIVVQEEKYCFQSKPIPWFAKVNLLNKINSEKQKNKKANYKAIDLKYQRQWEKLPEFVHKMESISERSIKQQESQRQYCLKFHATKQIPNFDYLHKKFHQQLQKKRKNMPTTVIKPFNLTEPKPKLIQYNNKNENISNKQQKQMIPDANNYIGSTLKYESLVQFNRQARQQQENRKNIQILSNKQRKKHQKIFAKYMRLQLKKQLDKENVRKNANVSKISKVQNKIKKQMAQIYKRVFERPFLFQTNSNNSTSNGFKEDFSKKAKNINYNKQEEQKIQCIQDIQFQILPKSSKAKANPHQNVNKPKMVQSSQTSQHKETNYSF